MHPRTLYLKMTSSDNENFPLDRRVFLLGAAGALTLGVSACGGGGDDASATGVGTFPSVAQAGAIGGDEVPNFTGTASPDPLKAAAPAQAGSFVHPGLLHTEADFERMRTKVAAKAEPWYRGWQALARSSDLGSDPQSKKNQPRQVSVVVRDGSRLANFRLLYTDAARAYQFALRWKISGDETYADKAVQFLNAWGSTLTEITGNADRYLAAGIYGYQFANAAEIMRTYEGWAESDFSRFKDMMLRVFYQPLNHRFLIEHNDADIANYWANWDLCSLASMLAIGVLCDRRDIYDEAMHYFKTGQGNGSGLQMVYQVHPGYLGQWQESGRDQGHCTLGIGLAAAFCEMAWNQGDDAYGYENNRFLAGAEYVAKSNLPGGPDNGFYDVPFFTYKNNQKTQYELAVEHGRDRRGVWESVHNHYANRMGIAAPYTAKQAAWIHTETDGDNGDQLGFGTLTFSRDPFTGPGRPSGLTAQVRARQVVLSWWGCPDAKSYTVKRASKAGGPYTTIASGIIDTLTFTDTGTGGVGIWHYVVVAVTTEGESAPSNEERAAVQPELLLHLTFDEPSGKQAVDATGRFVASTLHGDASWTVGRAGNAVRLGGAGGHVALPKNVVKNVGDFTVATWLYIDSATDSARVFDLGSGARRYMMLAARSSKGTPYFAISTVDGFNQQGIYGTAPLKTGRWVHLAVTLAGRLGTLYVDGVPVGTNPNMFLAPCDLGETTQNWLGRSQFDNMSYLQAQIDDFRIYSGALDSADIATLAAA